MYIRAVNGCSVQLIPDTLSIMFHSLLNVFKCVLITFKSYDFVPIITNRAIIQLRKHLGQRPGDQMFLEFNCGYFETKMESLRPSCKKLVFCPYFGHGRGIRKASGISVKFFQIVIAVIRPIVYIMEHIMVKTRPL